MDRRKQKPLDEQITLAEQHAIQIKESIAKLGQQNSKLQQDLIDVKEEQKQVFDRIQKEKDLQKQLKGDPNAELRKQVEELARSEEEFTKRNQSLKFQLEQNNNRERVVTLTNQICQLNQSKAKLESENAKYAASLKQVTAQLDEVDGYEGYKIKIEKLEADAKRLRDKLRQIKNEESNNERKQRRQNQFLVMLEEDYRIICEEHGISASINLTRAKDINAIDVAKKDETKKDTKYPEATEENIEKLQQEILDVKKAFYEQEKLLKREIESLKRTLQQKEGENAQMSLRIRDREQEAYVNETRLTQLSRMLKSKNSKDYDANRSKESSTEQGVASDYLSTFDDSAKLQTKPRKLVGLLVWFNTTIYALQTVYEVEGKEITIDSLSLPNTQKQASHLKELRLKNESITTIKVGYSKYIGYLQVQTNRDNLFELGKLTSSHKVLDLDLNKSESVDYLWGSYDVGGLICLGVSLTNTTRNSNRQVQMGRVRQQSQSPLQLHQKRSQSRKEAHGVSSQGVAHSFDDSERLMSETPRIVGLIVWFSKTIYALQTIYEIDGLEVVLDALPDAKKQDNQRKEYLLKNESITQMRIGVGVSAIEYLWMKSNRDTIFEVGKAAKLRLREFDILKSETIASFHGTFGQAGLMSLGVKLRKKDPAQGHVDLRGVKSRLDNHLKQNSFYQI